MTDESCQTCGIPHREGVTYRHPFNNGSLGARSALPRANKRPEPTRAMPWPHDPVLRQALIDRGIITPDDLRAAEDKIRAVTSAFEGDKQQ